MSNNTTRAVDDPRSIGWLRLLGWAPVAGAAAILFYLYVLVPTPIALRWWEPDRSAVMRARVSEARAAGADLEIRHAPVDLDGISPHLQRAVVAAEDAHFWQHEGIDWAAIGEELEYDGDGSFSWRDARDRTAFADALRYLWRHRADVRGRSTITQQLAKNLYFSTDRSFLRKVEELLVTRRIERFVGKERILELYLNYAELGPGIFGAEAAARAYFGVSAADLTPYQAASLAATLPHPLTSNPEHRPGRMAWRRDRLLPLLRGGAGARDAPPGPGLPPPLPEDEPEPPEGLAGEPLDADSTAADPAADAPAPADSGARADPPPPVDSAARGDSAAQPHATATPPPPA